MGIRGVNWFTLRINFAAHLNANYGEQLEGVAVSGKHTPPTRIFLICRLAMRSRSLFPNYNGIGGVNDFSIDGDLYRLSPNFRPLL
jgi:hypothetical protein